MSSSLTQIPMLLNLLPKSKKVMVLTFSEELMMSVPALPAVGVDDTSRLVIVSVGETSEEFVRIGGMEGAFNPKEFERDLVEIARKTLEENPDIGAILQECTEMTPFSWAVQEATGLPVFDSITPIKWMYSGVVQRPYYGHL